MSIDSELRQKMTDAALADMGTAHLAGRDVDRHTDEILALIRDDPHEASPRPCPTCRKITAITGRPFWCLAMALVRR